MAEKSVVLPKNKGEGHRKRLREKFLQNGLGGFLDYEVVELLLTLNTPRRDCKDSAKELIDRFKTLQGVFEANPEELSRVKGVGSTNILGLKLIKEVADRYLQKKIVHRDVISNSSDLIHYINSAIGQRTKEVFAGIFLDAKNRVNAVEILFEGTLTMSSVYPREVIVKALEHRAASVIFAHNHPSGDFSPSPEDIAITRRLVFACRHVGITVHEHVITGDVGFYSFADHGYISEFNREFEKNG
ncbi:MAG: DNA repair protein RadC [Desulfamplus sp.]|nr:DNA repair protein RadC [Desulfamplus sp.]MBF0258752.1 DNA repair protein RadC [Desulfamplus sp.]